MLLYFAILCEYQLLRTSFAGIFAFFEASTPAGIDARVDQPTNQLIKTHQPSNKISQPNPTNSQPNHPNKPAGIDAVDAIVNSRPAHSHSSIVLKADQMISPCREMYDRAALLMKGIVHKFGLLL